MLAKNSRLQNMWFLFVWLAICWYGMLALHESGHVLGALSTGGSVRRVVLHPLQISRTDVAPNPHPLTVVWLGPIFGCLAPWLMYWVVSLFPPHKSRTVRNLLLFFAGFCCIANGAYIGVGAFQGVGDCGQLLRHGAPFYSLPVFGVFAALGGLWSWHRLGEPKRLFAAKPIASVAVTSYLTLLLLIGFVVQLSLFG